jgi:hypothetical protein
MTGCAWSRDGNPDGTLPRALTVLLNKHKVLHMATSREIRPSVKDRVVAALVWFGIVGAITVFSIGFFGFVLPSMSGRPALSLEDVHQRVAERQENFDSFWIDRKQVLYSALSWLPILFLIGLGLWCAYKVFLYLADRLDRQGHWNRVIAGRDYSHNHR